MAEWKINNWFMKLCFVLGAIGGFYLVLAFFIGFVMGMVGVI